MCTYLLNLCVKHSVLSLFYFLCDNLLLQKCVQSLCNENVILCVNLIVPITFHLISITFHLIFKVISMIIFNFKYYLYVNFKLYVTTSLMSFSLILLNCYFNQKWQIRQASIISSEYSN